ncbi:putative oxygenase MesX, partial [Clavibacter michiganensis]|uniref:putative oxygenase MesX n=2 Tax=Bacteria TaxID=2 RepID=UPI002931C9F4
RFNALMHWDNPAGDRYAVALTIVSAALRIGTDAADPAFPLIEMLHTSVTDRTTGTVHDGMVGNNFSSYVRDYDFSIVLPDHQKAGGAPARFGELHGNLFRHFLNSDAYRTRFHKAPVICLSVSSKEMYHRTANVHPILGVEYRAQTRSTTDDYFAKMGMTARYFMPPHGAAPLAFYHIGD